MDAGLKISCTGAKQPSLEDRHVPGGHVGAACQGALAALPALHQLPQHHAAGVDLGMGGQAGAEKPGYESCTLAELSNGKLMLFPPPQQLGLRQHICSTDASTAASLQPPPCTPEGGRWPPPVAAPRAPPASCGGACCRCTAAHSPPARCPAAHIVVRHAAHAAVRWH